MKKKFLSSILAFCMVLTMLPAAALAAGADIADLTIAVDGEGTISGDSATGGGTLSYYLVSATKQTEIDAWTVDTADTAVGTDLGVSAESGKPTLTDADNTKFLVVVEIASNKVVAAGQSAAIDIAPAPIGTFTPSVASTGVITDGTTATGTLKYAVVGSNPADAIATWTVNTTETEINTALSATLNATKPTLTFTSNGKYLVVVDISSAKAVAAGSCVISGLASDFSITTIGAEQAGGAGKTREITCAGTFTGSEYLVVQITEGSGETAKVSVVMVEADTTVTVSYKTTAKVDAWLTNGMPNLTGTGAMGVTIYDSKSST